MDSEGAYREIWTGKMSKGDGAGFKGVFDVPCMSIQFTMFLAILRRGTAEEVSLLSKGRENQEGTVPPS